MMLTYCADSRFGLGMGPKTYMTTQAGVIDRAKTKKLDM